MKTRMILMSMLLALAACASGPDYHCPTMPQGATEAFQSASPETTTGTPATDWWRLYDDPVLNGLVEDALAANTDIRIAAARVERERAMLSSARADYLPQTSVGVGGGYERIPQMQAIPGLPRQTPVLDVGATVGYEVDLFGRVRRSVEAARVDAQAAEDDAAAVRIVVVADTTRAYLDAVAAAQMLAVAQHTSDLLDQSLRLTIRRFEAGRAAKFDVLRIEALHDQQVARIPAIGTRRQVALLRLATLTGRTPADLPQLVSASLALPSIVQPIPVGDGAALLERRPDVHAAERRLAADTARIGIATADLYPRITLVGGVGQTSPGFADAFGPGAFRFLAEPLINWSFPNQSTARARIAATRADTRASLARFDGVVLHALEETESALAAYGNAVQERGALQAARDRADAAVRIVRARQREGQVDFVEVIDAERTAAQTDADVAAADMRVVDAQVALFQALGGGWQPTRLAGTQPVQAQ